MQRMRSHLRFVASLVIVVSLVACAPQNRPGIVSDASSTPPGMRTGGLSTETPAPAPLTLTASAPAVSPTGDVDQQVIKSYHTILMLGRADDLLITFVQKTQAGEIALGDSDQMTRYTQAFAIAIDDYNQTNPPTPSILNHAWKTVSEATQQYVNVYGVLIQGQAISTRDMVSMRMLRQLIKNYQDYAEGYLQTRGKDAAYFANEHQAVERHFQKGYGELPFPTPSTPPAIDSAPSPAP